MRKIVVNCLAIFGGLVLLSGALNYRRPSKGPRPFDFVAQDSLQVPILSAVVFVDVGEQAIERIVPDSTGTARLLIASRNLPHMRWLICAPGYSPRAGTIPFGESPGLIADMTPATGDSRPYVRSHGWHGPIPRECPQLVDSTGWYTMPLRPDHEYRPMVWQEPEWSTTPNAKPDRR